MTTAYALQILGISIAMAVLAMGGLKIASIAFDRRTREDARKAKSR